MTGKNNISIQGKRIRIFTGEAEEWQGKPLYQAILELARSEDVAVAVVLRGIEGFGPGHHLSTERLPDLSDNLPLILEIIASETRIAHLLPMLDRIVQRGIIITTPVKIIYKDKASS